MRYGLPGGERRGKEGALRKEQAVGRKKRLANIELLRALAMMMVVVMHFLRESGGLLPEQPFLSGDVTAGVFPAASTKQLIGTFLEAFCIMAVNAYVFISG